MPPRGHEPPLIQGEGRALTLAEALPRCHRRLRAQAVAVPFDAEWVSALDTLVADVHFPASTNPRDIAYKAVAVNISDLAAMGAAPRSVSVAIAAPSEHLGWLRNLDDGLQDVLDGFGLLLDDLELVHGPTLITVHANGTVPRGLALTRADARSGDTIFVSGTLGDAAAGLDIALGRRVDVTDSGHRDYLRGRLDRPTPRVCLGAAMRGRARAAIDVSDGLAQDLGHILEASGVGAVIHAGDLPLSAALRCACNLDEAIQHALHGGDDYEICFTAPKGTRIPPDTAGCPITPIGEIRSDEGLSVLGGDGQHLSVGEGYDHFT